MELATTDLILLAVRHNLGIGFVPEEFAEEEKKAENVFEIEVEEKLPTRNIILIYDTEYPSEYCIEGVSEVSEQSEELKKK